MATLTYAALPAAGRPGLGILRRLTAAFDLYLQRRALARLDDIALRDIGLTAVEAHLEAARPAWDMPANWLR